MGSMFRISETSIPLRSTFAFERKIERSAKTAEERLELLSRFDTKDSKSKVTLLGLLLE